MAAGKKWKRCLITAVLTIPCMPQLSIAGTEVSAYLKRIEVVDSNNYRLDRSYQRMVLPDSIEKPVYQKLRAYHQFKLKSGKTNDFANILTITAWVSQRWQHDPYGIAPENAGGMDILQAAEAGERFSCLEYSKVLRDMLHAHGYVARTVNLQSSDIAYGGLGTAHVAVEVYVPHLNKWVFLDPQWGKYLVVEQNPLSVYEYQELIATNNVQKIRSSSVIDSKTDNDSKYEMFLRQYLGYYSVDQMTDEERVHVLLAMQGKQWPITFQGLPRNAQIFSHNPDDVYFDLNRTSLVMRYRTEVQPLHSNKIEIDSEDDYMKKMQQFAAVPEFDITVHNNMPWFKYYEYRIDKKKWHRLNAGDKLSWRVHTGINYLEARSVNTQGRHGETTFLQINYARNQ